MLTESLTPENICREGAADALIEEAGSLKNWIDSFCRVVPTGSIAHVRRAIDELGACVRLNRLIRIECAACGQAGVHCLATETCRRDGFPA